VPARLTNIKYITTRAEKVASPVTALHLNILFNQDNKNQKAIHDTSVGGDMPFAEFKKFFSECTREPYVMHMMENTAAVSIVSTTRRHQLKTRCEHDVSTM